MKVILFANTDWYLYNFRLPLAQMLREQGAEVTLLSPSGDYVQRLHDAGFRWLELSMSGSGVNPFIELGTLLKISRVYGSEKPDLVHHFTPKCVLYGSFAARWNGIRSVVNAITGLGYLFTASGSWRQLRIRFAQYLYRLALRGTQVVFQNPDDRHAFVQTGIVSQENSHLVPGSGVDLKRFSFAAEPEGIPVVMLAARMLWEKGVGDFVEAARLVNHSGNLARFVLVGDTYAGNPSAIPAAQLSRWQEEAVVEWWGWHDDMPAILSQAHIICLPTFYKEGLPRVLVEGAACGRPLIASDIPGCRDIVRDGENGLLVPARNPSALAEAILRLLPDSELRRRMGAKARSIVEREFSVEQVNRSTLAVYARAGQAGIS